MAGTIQDIERATRLAMDVLGQRMRTEPPCHIQITLPGRVTEADTPDALETEIDSRDLTLIRTIRIQVGAKRGTRATIHVERQPPAMTAEVSGEDRTRVEGLISQLDDLLRKGRQPLRANTIQILLVLSAVALATGVGLVTRAIERYPTELSPTGSALVILSILVAIGIVLGGIWLFPGLELLEPGSPTRARRFRFAILAFVVSILSSLVAAMIYDVAR